MADKEVIFTNRASFDLDEIENYIAKDSPSFSKRFVEEIIKETRILSSFPTLGRKVPEFNDENIREIFKGKYRIIYSTATDKLTILRIIHGARLLDV